MPHNKLVFATTLSQLITTMFGYAVFALQVGVKFELTLTYCQPTSKPELFHLTDNTSLDNILKNNVDEIK